jgi:penicillin amidase
MNLPADYPYRERIIDFSWSDPFRYNRIAQVLSEPRKHSLEESLALQHDVTSLPAQALLKLLPPALSPEAAKAAALLKGWNCRVEADSAAALLYEMVMPELSAAFRELIIPAAAQDLIPTVNLSEMLRILAAPDKRLGSDPQRARDGLIDKALASGWRKAERQQGGDPAKWRWGDAHQVVIAHPLASSIPEIAAAFPKIEGGRSGGDGTTPMARGVSPSRGFNVSHGASYQIVADVGAWDNSLVLLLPGQSADPRSPHYRDYYPLWLEAKAQPLPFSKAAVDAQTRTRFTLMPSR